MSDTSNKTISLKDACEEAIAHHIRGKLQEAENLYRAILRVDPTQPDVNHNYGILLCQMGQNETGLNYLKNALVTNSSHEQFLLSYSVQLLAAGQAKSALNILKAAIQRGLNTQAVQTVLQRTESAVLKGIVGKVVAPTIGEMKQLDALLKAGQLLELENRSRLLVDQYPDSGLAWKMLAASLQEQGKAAKFAYEKAVELLPDDVDTYIGLGHELWNRRETATAVAAFERAGQLIPAGTQPLEQLACIVMSGAMKEQITSGLWADALEYLRSCSLEQQIRFFRLCSFGSRISLHPHIKRIFENICPALIKSVLDGGDVVHALRLHIFCSLSLARFPHTQEQWAYIHDRLNPVMVDAGESYRKKVPELSLPLGSTDLPVVAFIVDHAVSFGSGFDMLMLILEQVVPAKNTGIIPLVYTVVAAPAVLKSKCLEWGIAVVDFDLQRNVSYFKDDIMARLLAIREQSRHDRVSIATYFSTYEGFVCLASSLGLAPLQAYLTMGFHSLNAPRLDAYFACASPVRGIKQIRGRSWRTLPFPFPNPFPADDSPEGMAQISEAAAIRAKLHEKYAVILGTLARPEKLDEDFIGAVASILRQNANATFLWFGSRPEPAVVSMIESRGIADRCLFMGWVNTKIYSRVLDIHLDCFGLPNGLTMAETFSAGTAYVLRRGVESENIGMTSMLVSISKEGDGDQKFAEARSLFLDSETGENLMMLAETTGAYINYANRLVRDLEFRRKVGNAAKQFMVEYFHDSCSMGTAFGEHLAEVIDQFHTQASPDSLVSELIR